MDVCAFSLPTKQRSSVFREVAVSNSDFPAGSQPQPSAAGPRGVRTLGDGPPLLSGLSADAFVLDAESFDCGVKKLGA